MSTLRINFVPPTQTPLNGYRVRYRPKATNTAYVTINATASPIEVTGVMSNTEYEGTIESDCGNGFYSMITNFSTTSCFCPDGYSRNVEGNGCYKITQVSATPPVGGGAPENTIASKDSSYSNYGSYIYKPGFNVNGTGQSTQIPTSNPFWGNFPGTNTTKGPLNRTGLWTSPIRANQDIGFSVCVNLPATKLYYIGIAGDNKCIIKLDGNTIVDQDIAALGTQYANNPLEQQIPFKIWHIYPLVISSGPHIIELTAHNIDPPASLGAEIYDATIEELIATTSYAGLGAKLIFSTKDYIGQPIQLGSGAAGYSCPEGYALRACEQPYVCVKRIDSGCNPPQ